MTALCGGELGGTGVDFNPNIFSAADVDVLCVQIACNTLMVYKLYIRTHDFSVIATCFGGKGFRKSVSEVPGKFIP